MSYPTPKSSTFPQFPCLPAETRLQIWNDLVEPRIVTFHPHGLHPLPDNPRSLLRASFESRSVCKQNYRVRFQGEVNTLATHRMDIDRDTFRTFQMTLPTVNPTSAWPTASIDPMALPIKKLMSYYQDTSIWTSLHPFLATQDPQPLGIAHLPLLREQTMVSGTSTEEWWVPGFQELGPQIINKPDDVVPAASQLTLKHHSACKSGAHFEKFNIRGDTGLYWPSPNQEAPTTSNTNMYQEHLDDFVHHLRWTTRSEHYSEKFLNPSHPRIGFRGYSRNCVSTGGLWGGFRYHLASGAIEFSPLSWYEVKDAMYANLSSTCMFPEMVIKIFIVHEGEEAYNAPHHCWTKVLPHNWGQDDSSRTIRCLWPYVQWLFNQPSFLPHKMQMDPEVHMSS